MVSPLQECAIILPVLASELPLSESPNEETVEGRVPVSYGKLTLGCSPLADGCILYLPLHVGIGQHQAPLVLASLLPSDSWSNLDDRGLLVCSSPVADSGPQQTYAEVSERHLEGDFIWINFRQSPLARLVLPSAEAVDAAEGRPAETPDSSPDDLGASAAVAPEGSGSTNTSGAPASAAASSNNPENLALLAALTGQPNLEGADLQGFLSQTEEHGAKIEDRDITKDVENMHKEILKHQDALRAWFQDNPSSNMPNPESIESLLAKITSAGG